MKHTPSNAQNPPRRIRRILLAAAAVLARKAPSNARLESEFEPSNLEPNIYIYIYRALDSIALGSIGWWVARFYRVGVSAHNPNTARNARA